MDPCELQLELLRQRNEIASRLAEHEAVDRALIEGLLAERGDLASRIMRIDARVKCLQLKYGPVEE